MKKTGTNVIVGVQFDMVLKVLVIRHQFMMHLKLGACPVIHVAQCTKLKPNGYYT